MGESRFLALSEWQNYESGGADLCEVIADTFEDAVRVATKRALASDECVALDVCEVVRRETVPIDALRRAHDERKRLEKRALDEAAALEAERAMYEKLKVKYGGEQ